MNIKDVGLAGQMAGVAAVAAYRAQWEADGRVPTRLKGLWRNTTTEDTFWVSWSAYGWDAPSWREVSEDYLRGSLGIGLTGCVYCALGIADIHTATRSAIAKRDWGAAVNADTAHDALMDDAGRAWGRVLDAEGWRIKILPGPWGE